MAISTGDTLPDAPLKEITADGVKDISARDFFGGRKIVLFGVPGAFTPTCSTSHLPGFLDNHDAILARGVDAIAVTTVNDAHVTTAWAKFTGAEGRIVFLADGNGDFTQALGLDIDLSVAGMGQRSKRYSMIVNNGTVETLNIEDKPSEAVISGAARILEQL